jgi:hypothetical protein
MRTLLTITLVAFSLLGLAIWHESTIDPYQEGMHLDYRIECENGFVYKVRSEGVRSTYNIQVLNSDGTPLRCNKKIY